jgi:hypothetical protein
LRGSGAPFTERGASALKIWIWLTEEGDKRFFFDPDVASMVYSLKVICPLKNRPEVYLDTPD